MFSSSIKTCLLKKSNNLEVNGIKYENPPLLLPLHILLPLADKTVNSLISVFTGYFLGAHMDTCMLHICK